ncbi:hypothetical protein M433DRAFT_153933 [Acidomyces richmondensis BFW]|nr:MAG: hypothetical protein FE78DRAFT_89832 [Acidomyces sp. 'richmondensis']KYG45973.1 hypothetical protein M433DRAFT_153933 [Acidomyces richmondensis BFW]
MGIPTLDPPQRQLYLDDVDADAVSMHTTRSDYDYDDVPELPSYSDSEAIAAAEIATPTREEQDAYRSIRQPRSSNGWRIYNKDKEVNCNETSIRMDERLINPTALYNYVSDYLRMIPPRPSVRIHGYHYQTVYQNNKKETKTVNDFDIMLGLQRYLPCAVATPAGMGAWSATTVENSESVHRGSWRKTRAKGFTQDIEVGTDGPPDLEYWCKEFCNSGSALKIFRVTRDVPGLDHEYLKIHITHLIRSTNYRGHIDISFPIEEKYVDIYSPHVVNKWRISWVRFLFYVSFLWILTWPILFFMTKRWDIYRVEWRFSWQERTPRGMVKKYATINEEQWFKKHAKLIKSLVLDGHSGDATDLPLDMEPRERGRQNRSLPQTGNRNVDAAVSFIQSGVNAWNTLQVRGSRYDEGWGADSR